MMLSEGSDWGERLKKESNSSLLQFYPGKVPVQAGNRGGRGALGGQFSVFIDAE